MRGELALGPWQGATSASTGLGRIDDSWSCICSVSKTVQKCVCKNFKVSDLHWMGLGKRENNRIGRKTNKLCIFVGSHNPETWSSNVFLVKKVLKRCCTENADCYFARPFVG